MQAQNGKIRKNEGSGNAMEEFKNLQETKLSSQPIFDGDVLHIYKDTVRLPNGRTSTREYTVHHGAVCVIPLLENAFIIKRRDLEVECDFLGDKTTITARLDITITIGRLFFLLIVRGIPIFRELLKQMKTRKGGAKA